MTRIAINGLGRIGRTFMKLALEHPALDVVAANDISDPDSLAYLIKYDSVYGKYQGSVKVERVGDEVWLQAGMRRLRLFAGAPSGGPSMEGPGRSDRRRSQRRV